MVSYHVPGTVVDRWETCDQDAVLAPRIENSVKSGTVTVFISLASSTQLNVYHKKVSNGNMDG